MSARHARPGLLLALLLPFMVVVQAGLYSWLYPRFALFAWLVPAVFAMATAGAALYCLPRQTGHIGRLSAGALAAAIPLAATLLATVARNLLLLERHDQARSWLLLFQPSRWWSLQQAVAQLAICCARGGGAFSPLAHWSFVVLELGAAAAGALYVVLALDRRRRPDGGLPG